MTVDALEHFGKKGMHWGVRNKVVATASFVNRHKTAIGFGIYGAMVAKNLIQIFGPTVLRSALREPAVNAAMKRGAKAAANSFSTNRGLPAALVFAKRTASGVHKISSL